MAPTESSTFTSPPKPSALTSLLHATTVSKTPQNALAIQVLHNLQHQHLWTDLQLHITRPSTSSSPSATPTRPLSPSNEPIHLSSNPNASIPLPVPMISGRPPAPLYIHPDVQAYMIKNRVKEADIPVELEWVLPMSIGDKWTLRRLAEVFASLPERDTLQWVQVEEPDYTTHDQRQSESNGTAANGKGGPEPYKDAKRILMGMISHAGMGGDGTLVYYIMQEGEVKPRQN